MITRILRERNFIKETILPRQVKFAGFEVTKKFDIERFGKKVQITKIGKLPLRGKDAIRQKIKNLKKNIKMGIVEDVLATQKEIEQLEQTLKGGLALDFNRKFNKLEELLEQGRTEDRENIKKLLSLSSDIFATVNIKNLNLLNKKQLGVIFAVLKQTDMSTNWEDYKEFTTNVSSIEDVQNQFITGDDMQDKELNLMSLSLAFALRTHLIKTNLQRTQRQLSIDKPVWFWNQGLRRFDPAPLARLASILPTEDYYVKHRAIVFEGIGIRDDGSVFEEEEEEEEILGEMAEDLPPLEEVEGELELTSKESKEMRRVLEG